MCTIEIISLFRSLLIFVYFFFLLFIRRCDIICIINQRCSLLIQRCIHTRTLNIWSSAICSICVRFFISISVNSSLHVWYISRYVSRDIAKHSVQFFLNYIHEKKWYGASANVLKNCVEQEQKREKKIENYRLNVKWFRLQQPKLHIDNEIITICSMLLITTDEYYSVIYD